MNLHYRQLGPEDGSLLADWLSSDTWPFHVDPHPSRARVLERFDEGAYVGPDVRSYWMLADDEAVGLLMITDLDGNCPMLDLRLRSEHRGRGFGELGLRWLTQTIFDIWPETDRIEGQTREDNRAMRRVFRKVGYVKEAHYREAWPSEDGPPLAAIGYGMLRRDWETGSETPVPWQDE